MFVRLARLVVGEVTSDAVLTFLRDDVRPTYRRAQWRLQRVLTDNGKEFKGLGMKQTRGDLLHDAPLLFEPGAP